MRDGVLSMAYSILGIIPQVMDPSGTKSTKAADPLTVMREWDTALQSIQSDIVPMLVECYQVAYASGLSSYVNGVYKDFKAEAERLDTALEADANAAVNAESVKPLTRRQFEGLLNNAGQQDVVKSLRRERKRTVKQQISDAVDVSFSFNHVPRNTLQDLQLLYSLTVISEDVFVRMAGRLAGIATDDLLLTSEEREKERKKHAAEQLEQTEDELKLKQKYMPEDDSTAALGKGSAAAPSTVSKGSASSSGQKKK
jgi:hypothetical protein